MLGREVYPDYYREVPSFAQYLKHSLSCPDGGMVDTKDLKSFGFTAVRVQVPLRVQTSLNQQIKRRFCFYRQQNKNDVQHKIFRDFKTIQ